MKVPDTIKLAARNLRQNQTSTEKLLWNTFRKKQKGYKIYRQKPIFVLRENSGFERFIISDFYIPDYKLIIEIDGNIHEKEEVYFLDKEKEKLLQNRGFIILRFTNNEVIENISGILEKIATSFSS